MIADYIMVASSNSDIKNFIEEIFKAWRHYGRHHQAYVKVTCSVGEQVMIDSQTIYGISTINEIESFLKEEVLSAEVNCSFIAEV